MRILRISFIRIEALSSEFIYTVVPQLIRIVILVIGVIATWYRRMASNRRYTAVIEKRSARFIYRKQTDGDLHDCSICLREIEEREKVRKLQCEHTFHLNCVDQWLRCSGASGCSLCRRDVVPIEEVEEYELVQRLAAETVFEKEFAILLLSSLNSRGCHMNIPATCYST